MLAVIVLAGFTNLRNTIAIGSKKWQMARTPNTLRVMTWNVEDFINDFPLSDSACAPRIAMYNAIKQYNPDVLCMQEYRDVENDNYYVSTRKDLESFGYKYNILSKDSIILQYKPDTMYTGVAIFSKIPFADSGTLNIINRKAPENMIYTDILLDKKPVRIFTAHLLSFSLYIDTLVKPVAHDNIYDLTLQRKQNVQHKIRGVEIKHAKEVAIIRRELAKSPYPIVYCGDINSVPASYTYNFLKGNLQDAFLEKGSGLGVTFYKLAPTLRIDVCLPDNKLQVLQCTVPQLYLSDHFPVVTDLAWKKE